MLLTLVIAHATLDGVLHLVQVQVLRFLSVRSKKLITGKVVYCTILLGDGRTTVDGYVTLTIYIKLKPMQP